VAAREIGEHGFQVVADHHRLVGGHAGRVEGGREARCGGFADHRRLHAGGVFQPKQQRAGVEFEVLSGALDVAVHRDEGSAALQVGEHRVERLVGELGAGAAEHDDIRLLGWSTSVTPVTK
jgi:hypothetical protein